MNRLKRTNIWAICIILLILIVISIPISSLYGSAKLDFEQVIKVYKAKLGFESLSDDVAYLESIVWEIRLPRIILAVFVGMGLSSCGVVMQALTRNVMAEPYTLGVASGASIFAAIFIAFFSGKGIFIHYGINIFAFVGALLTLFIVYKIAASKTFATSTRLILTGIAISTICAALLQFILATVSSQKMRGIVFWTMGGLGNAKWATLFATIVPVAIGTVILLLYCGKLNLLSMGDETAKLLGLSIKKVQKELILISSFVTGTVVAASGSIGFVGLVVPHIVRAIVGSNHRRVLPVSLLFGALFMIWADCLARVILAPVELPVGVLTAMLGGPFFLYLIKRGGL